MTGNVKRPSEPRPKHGSNHSRSPAIVMKKSAAERCREGAAVFGQRAPACQTAGRRSTAGSMAIAYAGGLCAVLAPPRKQRRRENRRGAPLAVRAGRDRPRIGVPRDYRAIEMPGSVAEQRDDDGEAKEER